MTQLRKTVSIDATPAAVWAVLGDLAATTEWLPGTVEAHVDGSIRTCRTADGNVIREEIRDYSPARRAYGYRHLQVPLPVSSSTGTFVVENGSGTGATLVLEAQFEALDPAMESELEQMFGRALEQALESLRRRVEHGMSWDQPAG
jgi:uncharacterized protein YndB with AHSA1/START domain